MRKTIEIDETYRKIWDKHDKINIDIYKYEILYVTLRWLVSSPIWRKTRDAHHGFSPLHDPWRSFLAVGLDFEEYVTQVWKLWINHRPYEDFVYSLINYIQLFENEAQLRKSHLIKKTIPETAQMWDNQFTCWPSWFRKSWKNSSGSCGNLENWSKAMWTISGPSEAYSVKTTRRFCFMRIELNLVNIDLFICFQDLDKLYPKQVETT